MWFSAAALRTLVLSATVSYVVGYLSVAGPRVRGEVYAFINELAPLVPHRLEKNVRLYHERRNTRFESGSNSYIGNSNMFHSVAPESSIHRLGNPHQLYKALTTHQNDLLVLPGGHAGNYLNLFGQKSVTGTSIGYEMQRAVEDGMVLLAICAPAYVLADTFNIGGRNHDGLGLFPGHARLARSGKSGDVTPMTVELCRGSETGEVTTVYGAGPSFSSRQKHTVLAQYKGGELDGQSAVVSARVGKGKVILCGIHPESTYLRCHDWATVFSELYKELAGEFHVGDSSLLDVLKRHEPDECVVFPEDLLLESVLDLEAEERDRILRCGICGVENLVLNLQLIDHILAECDME